MIGYILFISLLTHVRGEEQRESRIVNIEQGPVKGYLLPHGVFGFLGIPYATVPMGKNRFKAPLPAPTFNEIFEAINNTKVCPQNVQHEENNCLVTSIYVPKTNVTNLPVMVVVHPGGYQAGTGHGSTLNNLVKKNIIIATFNYRLGAHGFLCLGTESIPGNAGMKDQVAIIRWIHRNIANFGGNPNDISISGFSAGARSVDLLLLSKATRHLIKGVISDSGSGLAISSVQVDPLENAKRFARMLNFTNVDDIMALENFYLTASFEKLTSIVLMNQQDFLFTPCVERFVGEEIVLHDSPYNILKSGDYVQIPTIVGYTEAEGSVRIGVFPQWKDEMNKNFSNFLPHDLKFPSQQEKEEVANRVKAFYFSDKEIIEENILLFMNYFGDIMYTYPTIRSVKLHLEAKHDQLYLYEFSYVCEDSPTIPYINKNAAFHGYQTIMVYDEMLEDLFSKEYLTMKKTMRDYWYNFIVTKEPIGEAMDYPAWLPVRSNNISYMNLNRTLEMRSLQHRALFWEDIYAKYYNNPIPPPSYNSGPKSVVLRFYYLVTLIITIKYV